MNTFLPQSIIDTNRLDGNAFFKFDMKCYKRLFEEDEYSRTMLIVETLHEGVEKISQQRRENELKILLVINWS